MSKPRAWPPRLGRPGTRPVGYHTEATTEYTEANMETKIKANRDAWGRLPRWGQGRRILYKVCHTSTEYVVPVLSTVPSIRTYMPTCLHTYPVNISPSPPTAYYHHQIDRYCATYPRFSFVP